MRHFFTDRNVRRLVVLASFVGLLALFRHLAVLLVFFVLFSRILGAGAEWLKVRVGLKTSVAVLVQVLLAAGVVAGLLALGVSRVIPEVPVIRADLAAQFHWLHGWMATHGLTGDGTHAGRVPEGVEHYAGNVVAFVATAGRDLLYALIGLILAVVFLLERDDLEHFRLALPEDSPPRILLRYVAYLCDAIAITARLQVVVALVNTLVTLPVLVVLGLPSKPALLAFLFVMSLIPVVGGVVSGAVLGSLAYVHKGPVGVVVFTISTFILHKLESYYLNPRLTARHVHLPGFVIVVSLILFEHTFGLAGLFMSFPALYVASRIREAWRDVDAEPATLAMAVPAGPGTGHAAG